MGEEEAVELPEERGILHSHFRYEASHSWHFCRFAVRDHFERYPHERATMQRFNDLFDITWADHVRFLSSESSFYLLKPKTLAKEIFGFEREVLLAYSPYNALEPRILSQVADIEQRPLLRGRTEPLFLVIVAPIKGIVAAAADFTRDADAKRIIVPFSDFELTEDKDPWLLRKRFSEALFARDLFDMKQALVDDAYFFGRKSFVLDLLDRVNRGENCGVYGLRKTGKTSALFKLRRLLQAENSGFMIYIDAQSPAVHRLGTAERNQGRSSASCGPGIAESPG